MYLTRKSDDAVSCGRKSFSRFTVFPRIQAGP